MTPERSGGRERRRVVVLAVAGAVACLLLYALTPDAGGLANWQESTRAVAARDMQRNVEFVVPTVFGETYLNKPPLLYWITIAIAEARGVEVAVTDLRLAVAGAGVVGVLATFFVTRALLAPREGAERATTTAAWAAALLATGVLATRSARLGEIDILLIPTVVTAVGALLLAWREAALRRVSRPGLIAVACAAAALAALAKGPPPIAVIACAGVLAPLIVTARRSPAGPARGVHRAACVALGATTAGVLGVASIDDVESALGTVGYVFLGGIVGQWFADVARPAALRAAWPALWRCQPWLVVGVAFGALYTWLALAQASVGVEVVNRVVAEQAGHNLQAFRPEAAWRNAGHLLYGVGAGSVLGIAALVRIVRERPPLPAPIAVAAVTTVLGLVLFSMFGKGVARYMTPLWPFVAMLGAHLLTTSVYGRLGARRPLVLVTGVAVVLLFLGQLWWYAVGRDHDPRASERRAIAAAIRTNDLAGATIVSFGDRLREVAFYLDRPVESARSTTGDRNAWPGLAADLARASTADNSAVLVAIVFRDRVDAERAAAHAAGLVTTVINYTNVRYTVFVATRATSDALLGSPSTRRRPRDTTRQPHDAADGSR